MKKQIGWKALQKRLKELEKQSASIPPAKMMDLLRRADTDPHMNIEAELARLHNKYSANNPNH
jgi:hypothetical protein